MRVLQRPSQRMMGVNLNTLAAWEKSPYGIRRSLAAELAAGLQADSALSSAAPLRGWQVQALSIFGDFVQALPYQFASALSGPIHLTTLHLTGCLMM
jgi:hypothetical protein